MCDRDYYGFTPPNREFWHNRLKTYLEIPGFPSDISLIIAEYGSTFSVTSSESCFGCTISNMPFHGPFDLIGGLDYVLPLNKIVKDNFTFSCLATCRIFDVAKNIITNIDLLSDGVWHRRIQIRKFGYLKCKNLLNPNGIPFQGVSGLPRDAYIIIDRGAGNKIMDRVEDCNKHQIITMHCDLPIQTHINFRSDIF